MTKHEVQVQLLGMRNRLQSFAFSLTLNRDDAHDLFQDTFLRAWDNREKFAEKTNFAAWIFTVMKNIFINNYRRKSRVNKELDNRDISEIRITQENESPNPEKQLLLKEVKEAVEGLSAEFKTPLVMHQEGYKYHEISEKMKIPIGTVKSRIYFAKEKLLNLLR